ncbi:phytoene desaturase family protein [Bacillus sp. DJP31]|uniref:phytoene desaturase family protein n=1 Tax=Bacillus sp. DJP31 TaxID=3409789 RepID=UPI003BB7D25E
MDIVVVGGGFGGLTAAAMLAKDGFSVTVVEASNEWGGCAGKFSRNKFTFPVGATLGMGFEEGGIHHRILQELGITYKAAPLDEVMTIHTPKDRMVIYRDRDQFLTHVKSIFPSISKEIDGFYQEVWGIANQLQELMRKLPVLPPKTIGEWTMLLQSIRFSNVSLLPYLYQTMHQMLKKHKLETHFDFVHFLDGILIDSMQTTSKDCSLVLSAIALDIYHRGAFYIEGGLFDIAEKLVDSIKTSGGAVVKNSRVVSLQKNEKKWRVMDHKKKIWEADHVICNLPIQAFTKLLDDHTVSKLPQSFHKKKTKQQWGAFTIYMGLHEEYLPSNPPLFQQVIQTTNGRLTEGEHIFLSLSKLGDQKRAPEGFRTLTVSTHTDLEKWNTKEKYDEYKPQLRDKIVQGVATVFPHIEKAIQLEVIGAPRAWERFTSRPSGMVGGYPQTIQNSLLNSISHRTGIKGLWLCGDSVFPGAGTIGVSVSGYHVYQSIQKEGTYT